MIRFLLDEHVNPAIQRQLLGKITQVTTFADLPAISGGLYGSVVNTLLFNWFFAKFYD